MSGASTQKSWPLKGLSYWGMQTNKQVSNAVMIRANIYLHLVLRTWQFNSFHLHKMSLRQVHDYPHFTVEEPRQTGKESFSKDHTTNRKQSQGSNPRGASLLTVSLTATALNCFYCVLLYFTPPLGRTWGCKGPFLIKQSLTIDPEDDYWNRA